MTMGKRSRHEECTYEFDNPTNPPGPVASAYEMSDRRQLENMLLLCLSKIKSEHIRGAIRQGLGGKEYALPFSRSAIGARPYLRPSACVSRYSSERKVSESGADVPRLRQ